MGPTPDLCPLCQCQCQVSGMWIQCPVTRPRKIRCICADNVSAIFTDTNTLQGWVVSSVISSYRKPYRRTNSSYTSSHNHTRLVHARSCIRNIHGLSSAEANPAMLQLQHAGTPASQSSLRWQQQRLSCSRCACVSRPNERITAPARIASELRMTCSTTGSHEEHAEHYADQAGSHAGHVDGRLRRPTAE